MILLQKTPNNIINNCENKGSHGVQQTQINLFGEIFNERKYRFKENDYGKLRTYIYK